MSVLALTQLQTFVQKLSTNLEVSGVIRGHRVECFLFSSDKLSSCALKREDIEELLPIFKELLELS